jgi:RNA polymerase sigma factor (sigma-70 family)
MTDQDKVFKLANDERYFTQVYNEHKDYSLRFLRKMYNDDDLLKDIYQDATIVLYENAKKSNFKLTCSIQTYLNSICRNRLLSLRRNKVNTLVNADDFDPNISDWFVEEKYDEEKEERFTAIEKALEKMKEAGGQCYEILKRFFYQKQQMEQIAVDLNYTNGDNVKNQKSRCQKKLKELVLENYESI